MSDLKRIHTFTVRMEIAPELFKLFNNQDEFLDHFVLKGMECYRSAGFSSSVPKVARMMNVDDYIFVTFDSDVYPIRVDIYKDKLSITLRAVNMNSEKKWLSLMSEISNSVLSVGKDVGLPFGDRILDYQHRFQHVVRLNSSVNWKVLSQNLFNQDIQEKNEGGALHSLGIIGKTSVRLMDFKVCFNYELSYQLKKAKTKSKSSKNLWLELQAPENDDNSLLWISFGVKSADNGKIKPSQQEACDCELSGRFHDLVFRKKIIKQLLGSLDFEEIME